MEGKGTAIRDVVPNAMLAKEQLRNEKEKEDNPSTTRVVLSWYRDSHNGAGYRVPVTQVNAIPETWCRTWMYGGSDMKCIYIGSKHLVRNYPTKLVLGLPSSLQRSIPDDTYHDINTYLTPLSSKDWVPVHAQYEMLKKPIVKALKTRQRWFVGDKPMGQRILLFGPSPLIIRVAAPDLCMEDRSRWFWKDRIVYSEADQSAEPTGWIRVQDDREKTAEEMAEKLKRQVFRGHAGVVHPCSNARDCLSVKNSRPGGKKAWWSCEACVQVAIESIRQHDPSLMQGFLSILCGGCTEEAYKKYPYPDGHDGCDCPARQSVDREPWLCFLCRVNELRTCRLKNEAEKLETWNVVGSNKYVDWGRNVKAETIWTSQVLPCPTNTVAARMGSNCPCGAPVDADKPHASRCAGCLGIVHKGFPWQPPTQRAQRSRQEHSEHCVKLRKD
ncbi:MAG: hypothetical protein MMC33_000298 [Icmadophila ericetorum]|nr:hypothetical protein [Icmadophila ericetorum]